MKTRSLSRQPSLLAIVCALFALLFYAAPVTGYADKSATRRPTPAPVVGGQAGHVPSLPVAASGTLHAMPTGTPQTAAGRGGAAGRTKPIPAPPAFVPGRLLVKFRQAPNFSISKAGALQTGLTSLDGRLAQGKVKGAKALFAVGGRPPTKQKAAGATAFSARGLDRVFRLDFDPTAGMSETLAALQADPDVEYAETVVAKVGFIAQPHDPQGRTDRAFAGRQHRPHQQDGGQPPHPPTEYRRKIVQNLYNGCRQDKHFATPLASGSRQNYPASRFLSISKWPKSR